MPASSIQASYWVDVVTRDMQDDPLYSRPHGTPFLGKQEITMLCLAG